MEKIYYIKIEVKNSVDLKRKDRSEQYEAEVKRVRSRVEELKKELASAQDDMDVATNSVRKLQRTNECLVEQLEAANMQLEHFKNR